MPMTVTTGNVLFNSYNNYLIGYEVWGSRLLSPYWSSMPLTDKCDSTYPSH